jgi:V-type H+-transporting ATPase subunit F
MIWTLVNRQRAVVQIVKNFVNSYSSDNEGRPCVSFAPADFFSKMANAQGFRDGEERLIAVIGDEDTVTGFLLGGIGDLDPRKNATNFLMVDKTTPLATIETAFRSFTTRSDIAIILINQSIAEDIRYLLNDYHATIPTVLEIPSKDIPYDVAKDAVLRRVKQQLGES